MSCSGEIRLIYILFCFDLVIKRMVDKVLELFNSTFSNDAIHHINFEFIKSKRVYDRSTTSLFVFPRIFSVRIRYLTFDM